MTETSTAESAPVRTTPLRAVGLSGSLREGSLNTALLRNVARLAAPSIEVEVFDRVDEIPLFNSDIADSGDPGPVAALRAAVRAADALVICTPEYNFGVPGVLKNALDWLSVPAGRSGMENLPVAILGASTSILGTARAQTQLRSLFLFTQSHVVNFPEVFLTRADTRFDADGQLVDKVAIRLIGTLLTNLSWLVDRVGRDRP
jgi:chromate reductase